MTGLLAVIDAELARLHAQIEALDIVRELLEPVYQAPEQPTTTGAHDPVERPGAEFTPPERPMFPDPATGAMREPLRCQRCGMRLKPDGGCPDPGCTWERHETRVAHARKVWTAPHR